MRNLLRSSDRFLARLLDEPFPDFDGTSTTTSDTVVAETVDGPADGPAATESRMASRFSNRDSSVEQDCDRAGRVGFVGVDAISAALANIAGVILDDSSENL